MRILFIAHYFQPEPMFFALPFAKELVRRGHEVEVLAGFPNYPGGKIYDEYRRKLFMREDMDGVNVVRVPLYPSHDQSSIKRMLSYTSLSTSQAVFGPWLTKKADVAFVVQGPATIGFPSTVLKWFKGIPFVFQIQDLWPDSLCSTGMFDSGAGMKILHSFCNFNYKRAERIVVISPGMKKRLIERGVPGDKIVVIYNWCDENLTSAKEPHGNLANELGFAGKFNIVFAGNMGNAQALDSVVEAADLVKASCSNVQFVFIGSGVAVDDLKKQVKDKRLNNVIFHPRKPIEEIGPILKLADVLLVHLRKDPLFEITVPSKTQAYLAIGRPILIGVDGDAADIVTKANAGIACESQNPESIASAVQKLATIPREQLDIMGDNGKKYYDREMAFSIGVDKFEEQFELARKKK